MQRPHKGKLSQSSSSSNLSDDNNYLNKDQEEGEHGKGRRRSLLEEIKNMNNLKKYSQFSKCFKKWKKWILLLASIVGLIFYCEFLIYYQTLLMCNWPALDSLNSSEIESQKLYTILLADPHLLGPVRGHWFDKLRREWQMHRAFQTATTIFQPEVVFVLGDLFDEGDFVSHKQFRDYVLRFRRIFQVDDDVQFISIVGNHDVGFHYKMQPYFINRFEDNFSNTGVNLHTIKDIHFITINSMAMQNDGCSFCENSKYQIWNISNILSCSKDSKSCKGRTTNLAYSQPIILQHFPTYRESDKECLTHDAPIIEYFRENWEVLSKESTELLGKLLEPRLAFSGHSHHFCYLKNHLNIEEFTIASFNWRNKYNPSFLLAIFTPTSYAISLCYMPEEYTVLTIYTAAGIMYSISLLYDQIYLRFFSRRHQEYTVE